MFRVGKINKSMSPGDLYRSVSKLSETKYFSDKFGLSKVIINNLIDSGVLDIGTIKNNIKIIMNDTKSKSLTAGIILVAMLKSHPLHNAILKNMSLELHDLYDGIRYLNSKGKKFLTSSQINALDKINQILSRKKNKSLFFTGEDATGKTTVLKNITFDNYYFDAASLDFHKRENVKNKLSQIFTDAGAKYIILDNADRILEEHLESVDCSALVAELIDSGRPIIMAMSSQKFDGLKTRLPSGFKTVSELKLERPDRDDSLRLLLAASENIEKYKKVSIKYNALKAAYELSSRYNNGVRNVQTAIDIIEKSIIDQKPTTLTAANIWDFVDTDLGNNHKTSSAMSYYLLGPVGVGKAKFSEEITNSLDGYSYYRINVAGGGVLLFDKALRHVAKNPRTVLYLENLNEAMRELHSLVHQLLDDRAIVSYGNNIDFSDVVFVGSSVLDEDYLNRYIDMGYNVDKIKDHFYKDISPQLLIKRFENKIIIKPSTARELEGAISSNIGKANRALQTHGIKVNIEREVRDHIIFTAELEKLGISDMERLTQFSIESAVKNRKTANVNVVNSDVDDALKALKKDLARSKNIE